MPTADAYNLYHRATISKITIDEAYEANQISVGDRTKLRKAVDQELRESLIAQGRANEAVFLDLLPYEKLSIANVLPHELNTREYSQTLAWLKQELELAGVSADSTRGREIVDPFMTQLTARAEADPQFLPVVIELGNNLFGDVFIDEIFPKLFFDARER
jgi:hypothetical protein